MGREVRRLGRTIPTIAPVLTGTEHVADSGITTQGPELAGFGVSAIQAELNRAQDFDVLVACNLDVENRRTGRSTLPKALLKDRTPTRVALTRRGDYFVDLSERTLIANQHRSDLFVSLHCNASPRHDAHGTEVFFFSEKPSNRAAELVALRENGPAPAQTRSQTGLIDIDEFLLRAERRLFWRDGEHLARRLQHRLVNDLRTLDRQVKSANFLILREARMPAVLVEVAFVDHPADAHRLKDDDFRWEAAQSILRGIHRMIAK